MSQNAFHDLIVPGLDVLIGDPSFLAPSKETKPKAEMLLIPSFYIYRTMDFYREQSNRGESARELTAIFNMISGSMNRNRSDLFVFENGMKLKFKDFPQNPIFRGLSQSSRDWRESSKFHAIAIAKALQAEHGKSKVAVMTGSDQLATLAAFNHVNVARINPDVYTGRIKATLPEDYAGLWWTNHAIPKDVWSELHPDHPLVVNQYVELVFDNYGQIDTSFQNIGRFDGEAIVPLRYIRMKNPEFKRIRPKTPGQAMLFDALLAPVDEIPIVIASGTFGTGKTFCTVAAALAQVLDEQYREIFVCPRDGALGREIGFLKGDKMDKILPQVAPIMDNLGEVLRLMDCASERALNMESDGNCRRREKNSTPSRPTFKALIEQYRERFFEFEPVIYMGGRSISKSFMIYDEFQDMERGQARALLSRIGNDSKIVIMGDPYQTTNPHLNRTSNGLSYSASKLAGDPLAAVISFDNSQEIVRSEAARHIAERLSGNGFNT